MEWVSVLSGFVNACLEEPVNIKNKFANDLFLLTFGHRLCYNNPIPSKDLYYFNPLKITLNNI